MDFYTFGLSLDPHIVAQRHVLYDDSDEESDTESKPLDPLLQVAPKVIIGCSVQRLISRGQALVRKNIPRVIRRSLTP